MEAIKHNSYFWIPHRAYDGEDFSYVVYSQFEDMRDFFTPTDLNVLYLYLDKEEAMEDD